MPSPQPPAPTTVSSRACPAMLTACPSPTAACKCPCLGEQPLRGKPGPSPQKLFWGPPQWGVSASALQGVSLEILKQTGAKVCCSCFPPGRGCWNLWKRESLRAAWAGAPGSGSLWCSRRRRGQGRPSPRASPVHPALRSRSFNLEAVSPAQQCLSSPQRGSVLASCSRRLRDGHQGPQEPH